MATPPNGATPNPYQVTGLIIKQIATLDQNGRPINSVTVTFSVGRHGPFTVVFPAGGATPDAVRDVITAQVNSLRQTDQAIAQLNQAM